MADQRAQTIEYNQASAVADAVADILENFAAELTEGSIEFSNALQRRIDTSAHLIVGAEACDPIEGTLYGDVETDSENTRVQHFLTDATLHESAFAAPDVANYTLVYQNLTNSSQAYGYLGYIAGIQF